MKRNLNMLNDSCNKLTLFIFGLCFAASIASGFITPNTAFSIIMSASSFIGITLISCIKEKSPNSYQLENNHRTFLEKIDDAKVFVPRDERIAELDNSSNITILTGESGSGKSFLIEMLVKHLEDTKGVIRGKDIKIFCDGYYLDIDSRNELNRSQKPDYIVLDQFETAIKLSNIDRQILAIQSLVKKKKHVLIVIRKEYAAELQHLLQIPSHTIYLTNDDIKSEWIKSYLQIVNHAAVQAMDSVGVIHSIQQDFSLGRITFIHLRIIAQIMADGDINLLKNYFSDGKARYKELFEAFFIDTIETSANPSAAWEMLYLLSLGHRNETRITTLDLLNVTFLNGEQADTLMSYIIDAGWALKKDATDGVDRKNKEYTLSHDYYHDLIYDCFTPYIHPQISRNIEEYYIGKRTAIQADRDLEHAIEVNKNRTSFEDAAQCKRLKFTLYSFLFLAFCISILRITRAIPSQLLTIMDGSPPLQKASYLSELALLQLNICLSVIYVYNLYYRFLLYFKSAFSYGLILGYILCLCCYIFPGLWGVFLGMEVMIIGFIMSRIPSHLSVELKKSNQEHNYNKKRNNEAYDFSAKGIQYVLMGAVVLFMGILYRVIIRGNLLFMICFLCLYCFYIFLTVRAHITPTHFKILIGNVIY